MQNKIDESDNVEILWSHLVNLRLAQNLFHFGRWIQPVWVVWSKKRENKKQRFPEWNFVHNFSNLRSAHRFRYFIRYDALDWAQFAIVTRTGKLFLDFNLPHIVIHTVFFIIHIIRWWFALQYGVVNGGELTFDLWCYTVGSDRIFEYKIGVWTVQFECNIYPECISTLKWDVSAYSRAYNISNLQITDYFVLTIDPMNKLNFFNQWEFRKFGTFLHVSV